MTNWIGTLSHSHEINTIWTVNTFPGCSQRSAQEDGDSRRTQLPNTFPGDQAEKGLKFRCSDRLGSTSNINQQKTQTLQKISQTFVFFYRQRNTSDATELSHTNISHSILLVFPKKICCCGRSKRRNTFPGCSQRSAQEDGRTLAAHNCQTSSLGTNPRRS